MDVLGLISVERVRNEKEKEIMQPKRGQTPYTGPEKFSGNGIVRVDNEQWKVSNMTGVGDAKRIDNLEQNENHI